MNKAETNKTELIFYEENEEFDLVAIVSKRMMFQDARLTTCQALVRLVMAGRTSPVALRVADV